MDSANNNKQAVMSFFDELKRRNVFRVGVAYVITAWLLLQVADVVLNNIEAPTWVFQSILLLLVIGFPLALILAWAFELTSEGIKKEKDIDRSESVTQFTGRKLDFTIFGLMAVAIIYLVLDNYVLEQAPLDTVEEIADKSIAVLPFVALSSGEDDGYFADGLTDEILNSLAQLPEVQVTARTSSFFFKGQNIPVPEIAARLGVAHVVEGSVRRSDEQLRVSAQLSRATDGIQLWSETYDRTMDDILAVQEDIAESIARALEVVMNDVKRQRMRNAGLRDVEAFIAYGKGLELNARAYDEANLTGPSAQQAHVFFGEVMNRVPNFAPAFFLHSDYLHRILFGHGGIGTVQELTVEQLAAVQTALEADLDAAYAAATDPAWRALIDSKRILFSDNWRGLTDRLNRAFAAERCMPANWVFEVSPALGLSNGVLPVARRTVACDPFNVRARGTLVFAQFWSGDIDGALNSLEDTDQSLPDGGILAKFMWTPALIVAGRADEANAKLSGLPPLWLAYARAMLAAVDGKVDDTRTILDELGQTNKDWLIIREAWTGSRDAANRIASEVDSELGGSAHLANVLLVCICGAPFDLDATPNFASRLEEANISWPPPNPIEFPAKDW